MLTQLAENRKQMRDCSDMCTYDYKVRDCRKGLCLSTGSAETRVNTKLSNYGRAPWEPPNEDAYMYDAGSNSAFFLFALQK